MRTDDALDRLRQRQVSADVIVFATQSGQFDPDWDALAGAPEVETVAPWALVFGTFRGEPTEPTEDDEVALGPATAHRRSVTHTRSPSCSPSSALRSGATT